MKLQEATQYLMEVRAGEYPNWRRQSVPKLISGGPKYGPSQKPSGYGQRKPQQFSQEDHTQDIMERFAKVIRRSDLRADARVSGNIIVIRSNDFVGKFTLVGSTFKWTQARSKSKMNFSANLPKYWLLGLETLRRSIESTWDANLFRGIELYRGLAVLKRSPTLQKEIDTYYRNASVGAPS